jgi:hypothetical protein
MGGIYQREIPSLHPLLQQLKQEFPYMMIIGLGDATDIPDFDGACGSHQRKAYKAIDLPAQSNAISRPPSAPVTKITVACSSHLFFYSEKWSQKPTGFFVSEKSRLVLLNIDIEKQVELNGTRSTLPYGELGCLW